MKPLTILVTPIDFVGHVNACIGATLPLLHRGHRVIFLVEKAFQGKLSSHGFEEDIYELQTEGKAVNAAAGEAWANDLLNQGVLGPNSAEDKFKAIMKVFNQAPKSMEVMKQSSNFIGEAIERYKPDLIWFDSAYIWPSVYYSGIPWVLNMSLTPTLFIDPNIDEVPPFGSGKESLP